MTRSIEDVARGLTDAQRLLVMASEPGGWGSNLTACGVEIRGSDYRVARALAAKGLGDFSHGSPFGDLYFNSALGLTLRTYLQEQQS